MNRLERYIVRFLVTGFALVAAVLLTLIGLFDLAEQLEDIGEGGYRFNDALWHTLLHLPNRFSELSPFIALLGGLVGLGLMTLHHELTAMMAAGMRPSRIIRATLIATLGLVLIQAVTEAWIAPLSEQTALSEERRLKRGSSTTESGFWAREGNQILRIGGLRHGRLPVDIELFELGANYQLNRYVHAREARILRPQQWVLKDTIIKRFTESGREQRQTESIQWRSFLDADRLSSLQIPAESLSAGQLHAYATELQQAGRNAERYELMLWRKAASLVLTLAMGLLAIPFATRGSPRTSLAPRLLVGALTGIGIFLAEELLIKFGGELGLAASATALAPAIILALLVIGLLALPEHSARRG